MGETYSNSGVDLIKEHKTIKTLTTNLKDTFLNRKGKIGEVVESTGHFANYVKIGDKYFVLCTDGVGTKVLVAQMMDKFDTIAIDMIAMNVNDIICVGAEPIALVDYLAFESQNKDISEEISKGLIEGARKSGIAIIGGETAILNGVITGIDKKGFDLAGTCFGIVDESKVITGEKVRQGDYIVGLASSGLHSNGYSLARKVLLKNNSPKDILYDDRTIGEELLIPTEIYVEPVLKILENNHPSIHGLYNITGSGFMKFNRLKKDVGFNFTDILPIPRVFEEIQKRGDVSDYEMFKTFNMGMGFAIITDEPKNVIETAHHFGIDAKIVGKIDNSKKIRVQEKDIVYEM